MDKPAQVLFKTKGLSCRDLEAGTEFEIENDELFSSDEECFEDDLSNNFKKNFYTVDGNDDIDVSTLSIHDLKEKMTPVTEDRLVLKIILCPGAGPIIPPKAAVVIHYNAYIEDKDISFDSTYKRGLPFKFMLGDGQILMGLDQTIATMKQGERAKVWMHSDYAYGPVGCPPRIPANANIVYEVEIMNFIDCKDAIEYEEMLPDDRRKASFEKVYVVSKLEQKTGNDLFNNRKYRPAASRYLKAIRNLEAVNAADEVEDKKRDNLLVKLYLNLALANLELKRADRAMYNARKALHIEPKNAKALYRLGIAYMLENDFEQSQHFLLAAKRLKPCEDVDKALLRLKQCSEQYYSYQKEFCKKMFQTPSKICKDDILSHESAEFVAVIKQRIEVFKDSDNEEYVFPSAFTPSQVEVIKTIAQSSELSFFEKIHDGQKIIKMKKKSSS